MENINNLKKKIAILENNEIDLGDINDFEAKNKEERKKWWSKMMDTAEKDCDRLKASELLGKSEADFTDKMRHEGPDGGPILLQPMSLKGLHDAINSGERKPGLCDSGG
jgi:hypothetical protein